MNNTLAEKSKVMFKSWEEFFSSPLISALCQATPVTAGIAAFFAGTFSQQQYKAMKDFLLLLEDRTKRIETHYVNSDFSNSDDGKRIIGKIIRGIFKDNRREKLEAMANLLSNIQYDSILSIDEKELYVDILDMLNSLQLSILAKGVSDMRARTDTHPHRGLGWETLAKIYESKGISKMLVLQSIRTLESNGLINQNTATLQEADRTHFITEFGEQFYDFISNILQKESSFLIEKST